MAAAILLVFVLWRRWATGGDPAAGKNADGTDVK